MSSSTKTMELSLSHAYSPHCYCLRCEKIGEGHDPEAVDAFFDGRLEDLVQTPPPAPKLPENVIWVDFRAGKSRRIVQ